MANGVRLFYEVVRWMQSFVMMRFKSFLLAWMMTAALSSMAQVVPFDTPRCGFSSWMPAPVWEDALLSGNGTMGAMVFGKPHDETIILNHAQCFLPNRIPKQALDQASRLDEIRQLLADGKNQEAARIPVEQSMLEGFGEQHWIDPLVPFANLKVSMAAGNISNYRRMVDFATGEAKVEWEQNGQLFQRCLFVSRPDSVVVLHIRSTGKINASLSLARHQVNWDQWNYINNAIKSVAAEADEKYLSYRTEFVHQWEGNPQGFEGVARVKAVGGSVTVDGSQMVIANADEVLLTMAIEPNYHYHKSLLPVLKERVDRKSSSYQQLLTSHVQVHGDLFSRVKLDLGGGADGALQSEALVLRARQQVSPAIIEKQFDAARYNILSSVGTNPPTLQGIWSGTWTPPWSSGFTHDGNVEVAVSHLLSSNTPDLLKAYMAYHERMMPHYRDNARKLYNARGIYVPAHSSSHGWNIHFSDVWCLSFWTGGAGWTAGILYDHYLYTGDKQYLAGHIYPFMKESAWFYEDFLFKGNDGKWAFSPSYSPENNPANDPSQACINATMDVMIAKELLRNCIEAGKVVGESKAQLKKWNDMLAAMPNYRINDEGALAEWLPAHMQDNYHHRHVSHLYALYERIDPDFVASPSLMEAARVAVEKRMVHRRRENGGEMVFGLAQMGMVAANLGDAQITGEIIQWMSKYYWAPSLATYHNSGNLFNMDMSGGFPAVILRALAYSEPGKVKLLPALPADWKQGAVDGMALRGQVVMNRLAWTPAGLEVTLTSPVDQTVTVELPRAMTAFTTDAKTVRRRSDRLLSLGLLAGKTLKVVVKY
ncbi:glycosyl hydrolase family 65 [Breznakibacter xylanolyticus]|uniref:Glycosyl hydrolase family 65 n=2 Tax=Breznakibacter xylanolyticus TaxID=990 RepID=A0A2W7NYW9_9BACT|nr:glycosyl hydrolase family 65 [Breznakibacter xylanolyticus]